MFNNLPKYQIKGNNLTTKIENGQKFKELIEKVSSNPDNENMPYNFISEIAKNCKIVFFNDKYYLKDYQYKGTLSHFTFLNDTNFLKPLQYLERPAIQKIK